jgi:hypothetical protein
MDLFLTILFTLLLVLQYAVFNARISKVEKTWDDLVVIVTAVMLGTLVARQYGFLFISKATGEPLEFKVLMPIFASLFSGIGFTLMPFTILDAEQRGKYRALPGLKPELLAVLSFVLGVLALAVWVSIGG